MQNAVSGEFGGEGNAKASVKDIKNTPSVAPADAAIGAGAVTAALSQARGQLTPLASIDVVNTISAVLTTAGVVVLLAAVAYRIWAKRRADNDDAIGGAA